MRIREQCIRNFRIAGVVLKRGAEKGLSLFDIGQILYRPDEDIRSEIEKILDCVDHEEKNEEQWFNNVE